MNKTKKAETATTDATGIKTIAPAPVANSSDTEPVAEEVPSSFSGMAGKELPSTPSGMAGKEFPSIFSGMAGKPL